MANLFRADDVRIDDAICATEQVSELRDELENWYDNLPENFQNGEKGEALQEAMNYLDSAQNSLDLPAELQHIAERRVQVSVYKRATSRAKRRDDAVSNLRAVESFLDDLVGDYREKADTAPETAPDDAIPVDEREPITQDEYNAAADAAEQLASEIGEACDEFEAAEFPGMYS